MSEDFEEVLNDDDVIDTDNLGEGNSSSTINNNYEKASSSKDAYQNSIKDRLRPKNRIAPGKVVNEETGKVEKSSGREIVDAGVNAAEIGAAVASAGGSAAAQSAVKTSKLLPKRPIEKAKDKMADKIDKKADKSPRYNKKVEDLADGAKALNGSVDAAKSAAKGNIKGVIEGRKKAKEGSKSLLKKALKIKLVLVFSAIAAGLLIALFTIYLIIGPLMETWQNFDRGARDVANAVEKFTNFYKGFGFQDSKTAFFNEMNNLDETYDHQLDIALLLSTIFYPETMGYDTKYQEHVEVTEGDPISSLLYGGPDAFISYMAMWTKDIINEAGNTYDDETGLVYNAAKIYRLRRLSAAMCERDGPAYEMELGEFLRKYGNQVSDILVKLILETASDVIKSTVGVALNPVGNISSIGNTIAGIAANSSFEGIETAENWNSFYSAYTEKFTNKIEAIKSLVSVISFGFSTISNIHLSGSKVMVSYIPYKTNYDKYEEYLKEYYFESVPEFKKLLPQNTTTRDVKKEQIISEINQNTKLFKDIFLQYEDGNIEEYVDNCTGAINNNIISSLTLPITSTKTINISTKDAFGIADGVKHNGITLTNTNTGINIGDKVYAVARGKVIGIGHSDGNVIGDSSGMSNSFKKYDLSENELRGIARLCKQEQGTTEGAKAEASLMANRYELYGQAYSSLYDYVRRSGWFANAARYMDTGSYTDSILEGVKDVLVNGNRTLEPYVDEHDCWNCNPKRCSSGIKGDICSLTNPTETLTSLSSIRNRSNYQNSKTIITNLYGAKYTFSKFPTSSSDPFGYTSRAYSKAQSTAESNSNWVKLEHEVVVNNTEYKFYTTYKYLGEISDTIKIGLTVGKEQVLGTVGKVAGYTEPSLYFEFRNEEDIAIDPTNLFVECKSNGILAGNDDAEKIWNYFLSIGYPKTGVAGIMGNLEAESGLISYRVQGDFSSGYIASKNYTASVDNGSVSMKSFVNGGPGGGGYGLAQWTFYTRKQNLYNAAKTANTSIGDLQMQLDFFASELKSNYNGVYNTVINSNSIKSACDAVLLNYESPAKKYDKVTERNKLCQKIYDTYAASNR